MKFQVGDLLITKAYISIMTKDDREEESNQNKIFFIIKHSEDDNEGYIYDLISQETGSISEWTYANICHCFKKA
jgi:hypothetical protein